MVKRQHHSGFSVADLERTVRFYGEGLGLEVASRIHGPKDYHGTMTGYPVCHLEVAFMSIPGGPPVEFIQYVEPEGEPLDMETCRPGNGHIALVVDDIEAVLQKLVALGGSPRSAEPVTIPSGPNKGARAIYVRDPDGITVELYQLD